MKQRTLIIVLAVVVAFGIFYFMKQNKMEELNAPLSQNNSQQKVTQPDEMKDVQIGDMIFSVPKELEVKNDDKNHETIFLPGTFISGKDLSGENTHDNKLPIFITYHTNDNEKYLSLSEWFKFNGPQTEKTSATSWYDMEKVIGTISYFESLYKAPTSMYQSDYYDVVLDYFKNKTDIYTVTSYKMPTNPGTSLTPDEQKSIENYEKIVNQIIESIYFVK